MHNSTLQDTLKSKDPRFLHMLYRIIELFRLEETFKIVESNC